MSTKTTFSDRLLLLFKLKGFRNANEFAKHMGYASSEKINRLIRDPNNKPSFDIIEDITNKFEDLNGRWLVTGEGEPVNGNLNGNPNGNLSQNNMLLSEPNEPYLPRVITVNDRNEDVIAIVNVKAAAGYLNGYADEEFIQDLPTIAAPGFKGALHRCFEVKGNSMPPNHDGSLAVGRFVEKIEDIRNRRVYIVVSKNDGIVLKRVINQPNERILVLISDNPNKRDYPNYTLDHHEIVELWEWRGALIRSIPDPSDFYNRMNDMEANLTIMNEVLRQIQGKNDLTVKVTKPKN
ncbi:phage repressor protein C with HTH and peptisase S24 domain [Mucilaginibacter gracilis]|uniref:Phage repressor protein C with HTH and peptisase S24 domain n=1 Tax=Mucilaginibacter gracilis TaxID=423350 RepID=A0A495J3I2_9SPHI|nr:S24 family peptidase [Mucilaginibacter gracilis]RKR83231.1 phage repressor protein C with HTH and peptisase S24 domain [Mucilaginibacter gracilis]